MPSPKNDDAPSPCQDRGAGNVIPFRQCSQGYTCKSPSATIASARRVRLFLGPRGPANARAWQDRFGPNSAIALPDHVDPCGVDWPVGVLVKVVQDGPQPLERLSRLAQAMRRSGVVYAALPHAPDWPNLWPAVSHGSGL